MIFRPSQSASPQCCPETSFRFLNEFRLGGPWVLTAIQPLGPGIVTRTVSDEASVQSFLAKYGGTHNVYFNVNPVTGPLNKKASRKDVAALEWLHVDIDPRPAEEHAGLLDEERKRALELLKNPPEGLPVPTIIVFSGGGYQGFWRLDDPLPIDGHVTSADDAARYNQRLETAFGADHCHNVDRIMRLPGTVNRPDAKKAAKGRVPVMAEVVHFGTETYSLSKFPKSRAARPPAAQLVSPGLAEVSSNVPKISDLDAELPEDVPSNVKMLIAHGGDPEDPGKYPSRSEPLWAVICGLVRANVTDNLIYSIITDADWAISDSVRTDSRGRLRSPSELDAYARRQIQKAREEPGADSGGGWLQRMNEKHAVIGNLGGRCRVVEDIRNEATGRRQITKQTFDDFKNRYSNQFIEFADAKGNIKQTPVGHWWLGHGQRRTYDTMTYLPGKETQPDVLNLWGGFAVEARSGDCSLFIDHVRENVCGGKHDAFAYVMGWLACGVQKPWEPGHSAIVLRGKQGTGKSFFAKTYGSLWGQHFMHVSDARHLVGNFNAHLRDCSVLLADEAFFAGDKRHASVLKMLVTESTLVFEAKGVDAEVGANFIHLIMASNESWVVPAGLEERRFLVLDVSDAKMQQNGYFERIQEQLDNGGREALLHQLLNWDISNFDVRRIPRTEALQSQKMLSFSPEQRWWFQKLAHGQLLPDHSDWQTEVYCTLLQEDYVAHVSKSGARRRSDEIQLGMFLKDVVPDLGRRRSSGVIHALVDGKPREVNRPRKYVLPDLVSCRAHWDEHFGGPYRWEEFESDDDDDEERGTGTFGPFAS